MEEASEAGQAADGDKQQCTPDSPCGTWRPGLGPPNHAAPKPGPQCREGSGSSPGGDGSGSSCPGLCSAHLTPLHQAASPLLLSRNFSLPGWFTASAGIQHI